MILVKTGMNIKDTLRQNIIKKINHTLNMSNRKAHIVMEEVFTPKDIEIKTLSQYGSLYGSSSNSCNVCIFETSQFF